MGQDLSSACQMFLVPISILFGSLGVTSKQDLKTAISIMGLATSVAWLYRLCTWNGLAGPDLYSTMALATIFVAAWVVAAAVHGTAWYFEMYPLKKSGP